MPDELLTTWPVQPSQIYVQAGSFARVENAVRLRARLINLGNANITQAKVARQIFFRVRFGPLASVEEADDLLATLLYNGHSHARLVVD
jgi:rare lipoprotein A